MADIVIMPKLGFDMAEGTLVRWVVQEGEAVSKGAILAEIETDKATVEVESAFDGIVGRHLVTEGEIVPVNTPIAMVTKPGEKVDYSSLAGIAEAADKGEKPKEAIEQVIEAGMPSVQAAITEPEPGQIPAGVKASPLARRMADDLGIDWRTVSGTGPGGRVVKKDIEAHQEAQPTPMPAPGAPTAVPAGAPAAVYADTPSGETQVIQLSRLRAAVGRRMAEAKQQVPHFYVTHEYDMAGVMALRKQVNAYLPDSEKTSVNDYILRAVALALRQYPNLNASLDGNQVVRHGQIHIGVAVAVEGGLLTVVCRDADRKPVRLISSEVRTMAGRAREGKVRPVDIEGSTFSVSNLGMFDVEHFIAIINPPEAAILAVGSVREIPVVKDGQVVAGSRMKATISVDHRVSDGAEAAQFMQALAGYLEEPLRLLI